MANFLTRSSIKPNYFQNFIRKEDLNVQKIQNKNWYIPKSDQWFFFYFWLSEDLSIWKMLREKEYGGYGVNFWKDEALYAELNERAEAAIISYSATGDFLQYL